MASVVGICNLALRKIGQNTINSLTEASPEAQVCNAMYEQVRDSLLRQFPWNFATKSAALGQVDVDVPDWDYVYVYPSEALHVYKVFEEGNLVTDLPNEFEIVSDGNTKYIACNIETAYAKYAKKITDPTIYDPLFIDTLACNLALEITIPITNNTDLFKVADSLLTRSIYKAMLANAIEGAEQKTPSDLPKSKRHYLNVRT